MMMLVMMIILFAVRSGGEAGVYSSGRRNLRDCYNGRRHHIHRHCHCHCRHHRHRHCRWRHHRYLIPSLSSWKRQWSGWSWVGSRGCLQAWAKGNLQQCSKGDLCWHTGSLFVCLFVGFCLSILDISAIWIMNCHQYWHHQHNMKYQVPKCETVETNVCNPVTRSMCQIVARFEIYKKSFWLTDWLVGWLIDYMVRYWLIHFLLPG